jgi:predicted peptidase
MRNSIAVSDDAQRNASGVEANVHVNQSNRRLPWLECALASALIGLLLQLSWPAVESWWNRPRPGQQVPQQLELATGGLVRYLHYLPTEYGADKNQRWPLLIFLHGSGLRGDDPQQVASEGPPMLAAEGASLPFIVVSPQCPHKESFQPDVIHELIENVASRFHVDRERIILTGYSMGGFGTWATAAAYPDEFAAIVPLCGGGHPSDGEKLIKLGIWAFHGDRDEVVPLQQTVDMIDAVRTAGGTPKLTVLPETGHGICNTVYRSDELIPWMLEQRRRLKEPGQLSAEGSHSSSAYD